MTNSSLLNLDECGCMLYLPTPAELPRIVNSTFISSPRPAKRPNGRASVCPVGVLSDLLRTHGVVRISETGMAIMILCICKSDSRRCLSPSSLNNIANTWTCELGLALWTSYDLRAAARAFMPEILKSSQHRSFTDVEREVCAPNARRAITLSYSNS